MPARVIVSPRFDLFLALAECLGPARDGAPWLSQARRKLDPAARRRMGDLALAPTFWRALAAVPGSAALDGDTDAVIAAFGDVPADVLAKRCRGALPPAQLDPAIARLVDALDRDPAGLQQAAVDALRRFDRLAFAALWRRMAPELEEAAASAAAPVEDNDALVFPSLFGEHRFALGKQRAHTLPIDRLRAATPQSTPPPRGSLDPEIVFRALGDATRYAIARLIARESLTSAELARRLDVSGPTLTHHLKALRRAQMVLEERRGNRIRLSLDRRAIETLSVAAIDALFSGAPVTIRRSRRNKA